jgi:hypothetical protein
MESQSELIRIAHFLLELKETGLLSNPDIFNQLKTITENNKSSEIENQSKELLHRFVEFFRKNSTLDITPIKTKTPERLYMDGVFDMVHSGHFNAIRQVNIFRHIIDHRLNNFAMFL